MTDTRTTIGIRKGGDTSTRGPGVNAAIVYVTARSSPRLDWTIDGLAEQSVPGDDIELIVVDLLGRAANEIGFRPIPCVTRLIETTPKPCIWQGAQRLTDRDWWAASNARNTGIILATRDYLAFLDDRCRLGPAWLASLRRGERERSSVLAGSYDQEDDPVRIVDHRRILFPSGKINCSGGWLYGGSMALPLSWILEVNGFEEGCDGLAGEDCIFGHQLANRGRRIDFAAQMYTLKERLGETREHRLTTVDKGAGSRKKSNVARTRFGKRKRTEFTPDLRAIRDAMQRGSGFPDVDRSVRYLDWFDGQPVSEMRP